LSFQKQNLAVIGLFKKEENFSQIHSTPTTYDVWEEAEKAGGE
jgi:hypothetical protein